MKHKTAELEGALLDAAVAKAEGFASFWIDPGDESRDASCVLGPHRAEDSRFDWCPSTAWEQGGPIIERERISVGTYSQDVWSACFSRGRRHYGQAPLIAAMRAFVASKLGEEVDL
jgi:hypothetical protein